MLAWAWLSFAFSYTHAKAGCVLLSGLWTGIFLGVSFLALRQKSMSSSTTAEDPSLVLRSEAAAPNTKNAASVSMLRNDRREGSPSSSSPSGQEELSSPTPFRTSSSLSGEPPPQTALYLSKFARKPRWAPNSTTKNCSGCKRSFGRSVWRHHCRGCGLVFCNACAPSPGRSMPPHFRYKGPQRCCVPCAIELKKLGDFDHRPAARSRSGGGSFGVSGGGVSGGGPSRSMALPLPSSLSLSPSLSSSPAAAAAVAASATSYTSAPEGGSGSGGGQQQQELQQHHRSPRDDFAHENASVDPVRAAKLAKCTNQLAAWVQAEKAKAAKAVAAGGSGGNEGAGGSLLPGGEKSFEFMTVSCSCCCCWRCCSSSSSSSCCCCCRCCLNCWRWCFYLYCDHFFFGMGVLTSG